MKNLSKWWQNTTKVMKKPVNQRAGEMNLMTLGTVAGQLNINLETLKSDCKQNPHSELVKQAQLFLQNCKVLMDSFDNLCSCKDSGTLKISYNVNKLKNKNNVKIDNCMSYFKVLGSETTELIPRASEAMIANNSDKFRKEISNIYRRAMRYPVHLLIIHGDALNSDGNGFS